MQPACAPLMAANAAGPAPLDTAGAPHEPPRKAHVPPPVAPSEAVLLAIYGEAGAAAKKAEFEASLRSWWATYAERKARALLAHTRRLLRPERSASDSRSCNCLPAAGRGARVRRGHAAV